MRAEHFLTIAIVAATLLGCQSTPTSDADPANGASSGPSASDGTEKTVAYIDGQPATRSALYTLLAEAHGGEALTELILDRAVPRRLEAEGLALTQADLDALAEAGYSEREIWDIGAITAFFNLSNRLASFADMRPNEEFHTMGR